MNITNKTSRPIRIPLSDGKNLFLGPRKTGQITPRSAKHPALIALVEAGDIELDDSGNSQSVDSSHSSLTGSGNQGGGPPSNIRRTGDR